MRFVMRLAAPLRTSVLFCRPAAVLVFAIAALSGCAGPPAAPSTADAEGWQVVTLPGKTSTQYRWVQKEGRRAISAESKHSASLWRRQLEGPHTLAQHIQFSWWVQDLVPGGNVAVAEHEDAAARVLLAFQGDIKKLPARTRMMFDLAEALTGETPPYATLMYVWDATAPVGTVIVNPRSDRIRKIVVDSGPGELRQWRQHRRNLAADFRLAFGEEPGPLSSVAIMSDSDNTRSSAKTWFGEIHFD